MSWSMEISTQIHVVYNPSYPDGALIDVAFECGKCSRKLIAEGVEIPNFGIGDSEEESRRWGDSVTVECKCGLEYDVVAHNSIAGWMVEFEGEKPPETFRYKEIKIFGESKEEDL